MKYSVNVIWSDEDEAFLATIPEFPGLSAFGNTHEIAVKDALLIAQRMIDIQKEDGEPVPKPITYKKRR